MKWLWKILVFTAFLPFACCEADANEYGPFIDLPLAHKLKGLDYEIQNDREEEIGIKEEVQRQVAKQAEITHSIINNGPKVAHIPSLEELLADLPGPLKQAVEQKRLEKLAHAHNNEAESESGNPESEKSSEETSVPLTTVSDPSLVESSSQTSSFPSRVPPPPIEFSQTETSDTDPASASASAPSSLLPPSSLNQAQALSDNDPSLFLPRPHFSPLPPLYPQPPSLDPSFISDPPSQPQIPDVPRSRFSSAFSPYLSAPAGYREPNDAPQHFQQPPQQPQPIAYRRPRQQQYQYQYQRQKKQSVNRFSQQQPQIPGTPRRVQRTLHYQRRNRSQRPLDPSANFNSQGYSFIQGPSSTVSVVNGIPLSMQPKSPSLLQSQSSYYPSQATDPDLNERDLEFSHQQRLHTHPEPILPDLPLPPVVAPV